MVSVDEELELKCELLLLPADFGLQVTEGALHIEVVAHRIPVDADQIAFFAERLSRRRKAAILETIRLASSTLLDGHGRLNRHLNGQLAA